MLRNTQQQVVSPSESTNHTAAISRDMKGQLEGPYLLASAYSWFYL